MLIFIAISYTSYSTGLSGYSVQMVTKPASHDMNYASRAELDPPIYNLI